MKRVGAAAWQRLGRITCWAWLRLSSGERDGPKVLRRNVSEFNLRQGQSRLGAGHEAPDRKQQKDYYDYMPDKGGGKRAMRQVAFDPVHAKLRISRSVRIA